MNDEVVAERVAKPYGEKGIGTKVSATGEAELLLLAQPVFQLETINL